MKVATPFHFLKRPAAAVTALLCAALSAQAATIVVTSRDPAGVGFNDTTSVDPVGGNPGTTLGAQRWNVYQRVAQIWGAALQSNVTITVNAGWEALDCNATAATLGSAAPWNYWHDFDGGVPGTWYPQALANKLAGINLSEGQPDDGSGFGNVDIVTQFNVNLGKTGCLDGTPFYLGLDGKAGSQVNFMITLLHELGHGLGFSINFTNSATGQRVLADASAYAPVGSNEGLPSIWETFMYDNTLGRTWLNTSGDAERKASSVNNLNLAWNGPNAVAGYAQLTGAALRVSTPAQGTPSAFSFGQAAFGPAVSVPMALGNVVDTASQACAPLAANSLKGKVAVIDRGNCPFVGKAKVAQDAGAVGVIIVNNAPGVAPGMSGADATVVIPTVSVSQADGATLRTMITAAVKYGSRSTPGMVNASLGLDGRVKTGADAGGRPLLFAPNPYVAGSSVSHWDVSAFPNLLMEPNINSDLTTILVPPYDLTLPLLKDIGW